MAKLLSPDLRINIVCAVEGECSMTQRPWSAV
jgi:hypothetical protein